MRMPKTPRQASYLQRRGPIWYFRFKLPSQIQSVAERNRDTCESGHVRAVDCPRTRGHALALCSLVQTAGKKYEQTDARRCAEGTGPLVHGHRRGVGAHQSTLVATKCTQGLLPWHAHRPEYVGFAPRPHMVQKIKRYCG